ncbi:NADPH-dependent FMN reductase [Bernardetia sp.]|uniref:NADPH-dependent FMN reductase n=1 Tax=Bernardetia sp. TaxID=1937974 RepID=UPI0025C1940F|nr:NAD(P)H-dependent oxidoreductase [Bernardetia sp.]
MITIISGTNRKGSVTYNMALFYQKKLEEKGVQSTILDLKELPHDFAFSALYENTGKSETFNRLISPIKDSEKLIVITPEYNGSFPGIIKTFLDGLEFPNTVKGKKVALVGLSSGSQGAVLATSHLSDIFGYLGAAILPLRARMPFIEKHFDGEKIVNDNEYAKYNDLIDLQIENLIAF